MSDVRDFFCESLDNSGLGIRSAMDRLMRRLSSEDPPLHAHLSALRVHPQMFAFRWLTLLLTQELGLRGVLRCWDSLLAAPGEPGGRLGCMLRLCVAMLVCARGELLGRDFGGCVKLLQRYPMAAEEGEIAEGLGGLEETGEGGDRGRDGAGEEEEVVRVRLGDVLEAARAMEERERAAEAAAAAAAGGRAESAGSGLGGPRVKETAPVAVAGAAAVAAQAAQVAAQAAQAAVGYGIAGAVPIAAAAGAAVRAAAAALAGAT